MQSGVWCEGSLSRLSQPLLSLEARGSHSAPSSVQLSLAQNIQPSFWVSRRLEKGVFEPLPSILETKHKEGVTDAGWAKERTSGHPASGQ